MSTKSKPNTFTVPTSEGDALGTCEESDLNGGYWWNLQHPWGETRFAGTKREATAKLKRIVEAFDKEATP